MSTELRKIGIPSKTIEVMDNKRERIDNTDKRKANKTDMKIASVYKLLGQTHLNKIWYDQAIQLLSRNIEKGLNAGDSYFHRGFFYFQKGENNKSQADLNRAKAFGYQVSEEYVDNLFMCFKRENN